ncbi:MAG TPA: GMC family oxidoreductase [Vicinamibacterales bacterium]|nr:GMC family oxidoreductase [Vicinamibacterales bacterium]
MLSERQADLCILGSGIAGLLLAERALAGGRRVLLVERGTPMSFADRVKQGSHDDPLPFNSSPHRFPHEPPPSGPRTRWDDRYVFWPVYNLGGCTNIFFGNVPRMHPSHFTRDAFGGASRRWPITYEELEPFYLQAEKRLGVSGNSEQPPFAGHFDYPLPPHRLSPSDRACEAIFGPGSVTQVPTVRPSREVGGRPRCCSTNECHLCPIDSKGTALNTVYPAVKDRIELLTGWLAVDLHCAAGRVTGVSCVDAQGGRHRIHARDIVVACNGIDSCLLLQRSPSVPRLPSLGRYYMDHPVFELAIYDTGLDTRPGYGDSAQTGMLMSFFDRVAPDLPVSMLGEIKSSALSLNRGELTRDAIVRDLLHDAIERRADEGGSVRDHFTRAWGSTLVLWFAVETQPVADHTVEIGRVTESGQAIPRIVHRYPTYFAECIARAVATLQERRPQGRVKHISTFCGSYHWLGATRMGSIEDGCVDRHLRYHELENLYVLSTSTFPGGSSANPTLTLTALTLRLGDHLSAGNRAGAAQA